MAFADPNTVDDTVGAEIPLQRINVALYEDACHEGINEMMIGARSGALGRPTAVVTRSSGPP